MTKKSIMKKVLTPEFRVSFPHLFTAKKNDLNGKDEYSVVALFPKDADLKPLLAAAQEVALSEFGPDKTKWPKNLKMPFKKQEESLDKSGNMRDGHTTGAIMMNLKCDASKNQPQVVDAKVQPIIDPKEVYAGCFAKATITFFAYNQTANKGVTCILNNFQKTKEGEAIGSRHRAEDDFTVVATQTEFDLEV